ncbi:glucuronokinase 1-like isoform X2 [Juglans microcarpa x Juglans regia]|uniref:glucuronokinase 1-like isoform X2 n=1 Tax=Juglans microcarpa x Juglans regia TaxID=2249226 RepID=UPI001B7DB163|nr:glucuronokinase 1-like isoform X2 [Juglans microcarpa x Juglans regia]
MGTQSTSPVSISNAIEHKAYARVGLLGNPSDVYYGRTISFTFGNFWASVQLQPSDELVIKPHPTHDLVQFRSLDHLVNRLNNEGYYGGVRLLMAICKVFYNYCKENKIDICGKNFTLSYDTNIPRQTGLSGSSAIVCAALSCLLDFYEVRHLIKVEVRPTLVLAAEQELGIVAGLQDRVAQVYGGLVYMVHDLNFLQVHSTVRQRWLNGDKFILSSMLEVANVAKEGRTALLEKDHSKLAKLMDCNFDLRRSMFGDDALGDLNIKMVEVARKVGAASKFTGSGGAVIAFCPDGPSQVKLLEDECQKAGFIVVPVEVVSSCLNANELQTLKKLVC